MMQTAFCPAHVTGFFKAEIKGDSKDRGSLGAGFSIQDGVVTRVQVSDAKESRYSISVSGYEPDNTRVSEYVADEFLKIARNQDVFIDIRHEISIPVGYGLGCSGAVALSLAMALNKSLGTGLTRHKVGQIAHAAEISCKTGLGDVLASYHGGFEIRTRPGGPGVGQVEKIESDAKVVLICFSPISTRKFIDERIKTINGLGGRMVARLAESKDRGEFQDMSLEFARHVGMITPKMDAVIADLQDAQIKCGAALFGETVFTLISKTDESKVLDILKRYPDGIVIRSGIDNAGARLWDSQKS